MPRTSRTYCVDDHFCGNPLINLRVKFFASFIFIPLLSPFFASCKSECIFSTANGKDFKIIESGSATTGSASGQTTALITANNGAVGHGIFGVAAADLEADIAELVVYTRELSSGERLQLENYFFAKWGLTPP